MLIHIRLLDNRTIYNECTYTFFKPTNEFSCVNQIYISGMNTRLSLNRLLMLSDKQRFIIIMLIKTKIKFLHENWKKVLSK